MIPSHPTGHGGVNVAAVTANELEVAETVYSPALELHRHQHERANLCLVLAGALTERAGRTERTCETGALIVKPCGEAHSDRFLAAGARCLNVTVGHAPLARIREVTPFLSELRFEADAALLALGRRLVAELRTADDLSPLAVEGLVLELVTQTLRAGGRRRASAPEWLDEARDWLHDHFRESVGLSALAAAVGRHPAHVAQHFRARFGASIGEYLRGLRVEHVARRLAESREPLASLALEAGFADQSHMCRVFKDRIGLTPTAYRRAHG